MNETNIATLALIVSLGSLLFSAYTLKETKRMLKYQLNISMLTASESYLKEFPKLTSLHNIDFDSIIADGITKEEFYYILSSLRASEAYYVINDKQDELSFFRTNFLDNSKVYLLYTKYLRGIFFSQNNFSKLVDNYYNLPSS